LLMVVCWDGTDVFNEHHDIMHPRSTAKGLQRREAW
jgi:hypothetical protein